MNGVNSAPKDMVQKEIIVARFPSEETLVATILCVPMVQVIRCKPASPGSLVTTSHHHHHQNISPVVVDVGTDKRRRWKGSSFKPRIIFYEECEIEMYSFIHTLNFPFQEFSILRMMLWEGVKYKNIQKSSRVFRTPKYVFLSSESSKKVYFQLKKLTPGVCLPEVGCNRGISDGSL